MKGLIFDWNKLYGGAGPRRISLPTYPFAGERCWFSGVEAGAGSSTLAGLARTASIHPLLHQNTSNFSEQRFSSTFTGREFFLADHVVKGQRVLPGAAYLEMARAAVEQATVALKEGQPGIRLKNVIWARPIAVGELPVQVHIGLFPEDNGEITYEIYSEPEEAGAEPIVHSHGSAVLGMDAKAPTLDLRALQSLCSQSSLSSAQCYEAFSAMGIDYGTGQRGIEKVYVGAGQVLARLSLPSSVYDTRDKYILHPSLLDSAFQASIGLMTGSGNTAPSDNRASHKLILPFALQEIEILGSCTSTMWAFIRYSEDSKAGDKVKKIDIDLCDGQGKVCVRVKKFSSRVQERERATGNVRNADTSGAPSEPLSGTVMLTPVWDSTPVEKSQNFPSSTEQVVIVGGVKDSRDAIQQHYSKARILEIQSNDSVNELVTRLEAYGFIDHILWIAPQNTLASMAEEALIEEQKQGALLVFKMIKALLQLGYGTRNLGWTVITTQAQPIHGNDLVNPTHASLHGFFGSMAKEYPNWKVRLIDLEAHCDWPIDDVFTLTPDPRGNAWIYRNREWYRQKLIPVRRPPLAEQKLYRKGGIYVVIGGAGGIGEVWSEYMIRTYQARIIWIGRRQKDEGIQAKLDRLAALGPAPYYISADAADGKALQNACAEIKHRYSMIHGVIHSAVGVLDQSLANMDEERFQAGLSAKVDVSVRIAQVFLEEPLDFVLFFSSLSAFGKDFGQSSYASGCTFNDAFAHQLSQELTCAVKVMNWGYWGNVGVGSVIPNTLKNRLAQAGIGFIEPQEAMEALETLLAGPLNQIAFMKIKKTSSLEGVNSEELVVIYPENLISSIQKIKNNIPTILLPDKAAIFRNSSTPIDY
ncbi:polyketide synthase of type I [Desulfocucumis palustris]|uniref:Polyketide synthase of type I n=1 Tax=Desulfocucumis palustris TaxID=1898651 RepID=A0A2L2X9C5_9FIRM|nr:polyketide synthase of type I [Desulfocucumis palustris]